MRLIDADKAISDYAHYGISHPYDAYDLEDILTECPTVEAISKTEYEARLKADLKAILVELQLEIEELDTPNNGSAYMDCVEIIQQKIDAFDN